jgi:hypothetical protein
VLLLGCHREPPEPPVRLRASVIRPDPDTIRFSSGAIARHCVGASATLLEAASTGGAGVLVMLRHDGGLTADTFALTALGDSMTIPGAHVAARYVMADVAHGFALDSGSVIVRGNTESEISARVTGRGLEGTLRLLLDAEFSGVPFAPDSASCRFE